tara:strand:- start:589 stop:1155 length:567 start_codon:yes stop_codon:yes gene_type:complete
MRLDHIAYRVRDRHKAAKFLEKCLGYSLGTEFQIEFDDGSKADCLALIPPEERHLDISEWEVFLADSPEAKVKKNKMDLDFHAYHAPPEIFVSDGPVGSIVGDWVEENGPGVHHIAYQVDDVEETMKTWLEAGFAEFFSERPLQCEGLTQVFTKPSELTGVIYELINRTGDGFCEENVKGLMESTKGK